LRERPADIKPLIEHFLEKYRSLSPAAYFSVEPDFVDALTQAALPGNARQLENLVRRALVHKDDDAGLDLSDLPQEIWQQLAEQDESHMAQPEIANFRQDVQEFPLNGSREAIPSYVVHLLDANGWSLSRALEHCERLLLGAALQRAHGNQSQTVRILGITPRSIYNKVQKHQLPH
jgi:two-component system, NtrC family, response regulator AtoC